MKKILPFLVLTALALTGCKDDIKNSDTPSESTAVTSAYETSAVTSSETAPVNTEKKTTVTDTAAEQTETSSELTETEAQPAETVIAPENSGLPIVGSHSETADAPSDSAENNEASVNGDVIEMPIIPIE